MDKLSNVCFCGDRDGNFNNDDLCHCAAGFIFYHRQDGRCMFADVSAKEKEMISFQTKIYIAIAVAGVFAVGSIGGAAWSVHKLAKLEKTVETARQEALASGRLADDAELRAAKYKQKIEYLIQQIDEIQTIARKQDEELEKINGNTARVRGDVERAKRTRSIDANADELCAKLAELGHGCP